MVRIKRGSTAKKHRFKILKRAKGFTGAHSRLFRTANGQVMKALLYSYAGRKQRQRKLKEIWICRINSAVRRKGLTYSRVKNLLGNTSITINLKMLSHVLEHDPKTFSSILNQLTRN